MRGGGTRAAMRSISSSGVSCSSSTLVPRLSEPGSLCCFAQRYTKSHPSLRRRSMAKGGRAQYLGSRSRSAWSSASMHPPSPRHPPRSRCAGSPAFLWRHNSPANPGLRRHAGCDGASLTAPVPQRWRRCHWPGKRRCPVVRIGHRFGLPFPQTPINHTDVEVHMPIQTGAKAVDECCTPRPLQEKATK